MFIDTHCHLDDEKIKDRLDQVVQDFTNANVSRVINIGCNLPSSILVKDQAEKYDSVYFAAGFHPMDIKEYCKEGEDGIISLLSHKKCVAVGEIGLDYYWEKDNKERQIECFISQIEIAKTMKLPINVHIRDAIGDAVKILKDNKDKLTYGGVMHCYSGSIEVANELLKLGFYFSFGGTLTFKNARNIPEVASKLPIDRIFTETDCPYLSPEPLRGTVNEPKNIPIIAKKLAEVRGENVEDLANQIMKNAKTLFTKMK
ncbi:MAG: TatD family hydrolase [Clostridia bacterium]|nr:TatD family hydrolase [Clostridia bacterium]